MPTEATISLSIRDGLGTTNSALFYATLADTVTVADLAAEVANLAALVDTLVDGQIVGTRTTLQGGPVGPAAAAGSRVEQGVVIDFRNPATDKEFGIFVPSISDANIIAGKPAPIPVDALAAHLVAGATGIVYVAGNGGPLGALSSAFLSFRKRRKQLARTSFELLP